MIEIKKKHALISRKIWPKVLSLLILLYLISSIFSCQKPGDSESNKTKKIKGENQEYLIDSLRAADRLEDLGNQVIHLLDKPYGVDTTTGEPVYEEYHIEIYKDRIGLLNFKGNIDELQILTDKYKDKPQRHFYSYVEIESIVRIMKSVDEYKSKVVKQNPYNEGHDKFKDRMDRRRLGYYLARFIYKTSSLINHKEDYWLTTLKDVIINLQGAQKETEMKKELMEKERARLLEEKLGGKK